MSILKTYRPSNRLARLGTLAVLGLASAAALAAPTTKPAGGGAGGMKLVKPWGEMSTLTPEQRSKISVMHKETLKKIRDLKETENAAILAMLTDPQRAEYEKIVTQPRGKAAKASAEDESDATPMKPAKGMSKRK